MATRKRLDFALDPEELRQEVFEMDCERNQKLGLGFRRKSIGGVSRSLEALPQLRIGLPQVLEESAVDPRESLPLIQIAEAQPRAEQRILRNADHRSGTLLSESMNRQF